MIEISTLLLALLCIGLVIISAGLTYFILSGRTIGREKYNEAQLQLNSLKQSLDTEQQLTSGLREEINTLNAKWDAEKSVNIDQQQSITELRTKYESVLEKFEQERLTNENQEAEIKSGMNTMQQLQQQLAMLSANNKALHDRLESQKTEIEEIRKTSVLEFKDIANKLLEEKSERFAKMNKDNIEQILKPLGENIASFKKKVEETYDKESKERFTLEGKIKELVALNQQISSDANNLTNALKGQAKTQGDWGEMILENILEYSGLVKGREYFVQESFRDEHGQIKRPDVRVKYPDNRYVIIDSKVSLTAYERYASTDDPNEQATFISQHIQSIKKHIDDLASKEYDQYEKSLDFVMLFVAIEPAYLVAMNGDPQLWNYAYQKRILLISPTNLIAALKLVADIWKRDYQNKNAQEIAKRGEMLYEKFVGFIEDMDDIDKHLQRANKSWDGAMNKLTRGRGNLLGQAAKLKKLGLKPKKQLPDRFSLEEE